ncbi:MAG: polyphosphate kinase 2 [Candidatus Marinimicrobia bacterium]|nr:polyphosphate kinase 2 [Candidatus Neomarinimicrobiota bacterium]MBT4361318.1 polyphosphate kinase 2 [Candidatus Neomarinimicrobiota bacterium]MBT4947947.1 polyphosphate kinase 2 [Candidatus Neomarinimicrobiota bacterium]MBT5268137.1 polyphosphate kinase 2 [Candidatus Neomarinimicrobiota bacterium]MBT6011016.1 polyphosphate kinase 2 [Candidatus Neomarinimicrobiota bacterium]
MDEIKDVLKKKQKDRIVNAALGKYQQNEELKPYQAELIKLQQHIERAGKKMIILFDGRDASGKGGTIRRLTRYMNEKRYRVEVPGKPSHRQQSELHLKRYIERFPSVGEMVFFDRSWYNRALVEPVMGFCTEKQYREFLNTVNSYEKNFISDSKTILLKLYFSVSKEEQNRRFERRMNDPLRQWKLSEVDLQAQDLWDEFTAKKFKLLQKTNSKEAPWYIIRSDSKHAARLETMKLILNSIPYRSRSRSLDFQTNDDVVISGARELKIMERQRRKHGRFIG